MAEEGEIISSLENLKEQIKKLKAFSFQQRTNFIEAQMGDARRRVESVLANQRYQDVFSSLTSAAPGSPLSAATTAGSRVPATNPAFSGLSAGTIVQLRNGRTGTIVSRSVSDSNAYVVFDSFSRQNVVYTSGDIVSITGVGQIPAGAATAPLSGQVSPLEAGEALLQRVAEQQAGEATFTTVQPPIQPSITIVPGPEVTFAGEAPQSWNGLLSEFGLTAGDAVRIAQSLVFSGGAGLSDREKVFAGKASSFSEYRQIVDSL